MLQVLKRLPDVLCALGISQLSRINDFKLKRTKIFENYLSSLLGNHEVSLPGKRDYVDPTWHLYPIRVSADIRMSVFTEMRAKGIGVQVNYIPAYLHPVFNSYNYKKGLCQEAEKFYSEEISLPMSFPLTEENVDYIVRTLSNVTNNHRLGG